MTEPIEDLSAASLIKWVMDYHIDDKDLMTSRLAQAVTYVGEQIQKALTPLSMLEWYYTKSQLQHLSVEYQKYSGTTEYLLRRIYGKDPHPPLGWAVIGLDLWRTTYSSDIELMKFIEAWAPCLGWRNELLLKEVSVSPISSMFAEYLVEYKEFNPAISHASAMFAGALLKRPSRFSFNEEFLVFTTIEDSVAEEWFSSNDMLSWTTNIHPSHYAFLHALMPKNEIFSTSLSEKDVYYWLQLLYQKAQGNILGTAEHQKWLNTHLILNPLPHKITPKEYLLRAHIIHEDFNSLNEDPSLETFRLVAVQ